MKILQAMFIGELPDQRRTYLVEEGEGFLQVYVDFMREHVMYRVPNNGRPIQVCDNFRWHLHRMYEDYERDRESKREKERLEIMEAAAKCDAEQMLKVYGRGW